MRGVRSLRVAPTPRRRCKAHTRPLRGLTPALPASLIVLTKSRLCALPSPPTYRRAGVCSVVGTFPAGARGGATTPAPRARPLPFICAKRKCILSYSFFKYIKGGKGEWR
jgi:hypothetical protein